MTTKHNKLSQSIAMEKRLLNSNAKVKVVQSISPDHIYEVSGLISCGNAILSGKLPTSEYKIIKLGERL